MRAGCGILLHSIVSLALGPERLQALGSRVTTSILVAQPQGSSLNLVLCVLHPGL